LPGYLINGVGAIDWQPNSVTRSLSGPSSFLADLRLRPE